MGYRIGPTTRSCGFEALATTSAGFAWSLGKHDQHVTRDELIEHVGKIAAATDLPLNANSERCYAEDATGVAETVGLLTEAGAAGFSIEDYNPATWSSTNRDRVEQVAPRRRSRASRRVPMVLTAHAENHLYGAADLDDTIARLIAYRDAGADVVYTPVWPTSRQIAALVKAVRVPVSVLALPKVLPSPSWARSACAPDLDGWSAHTRASYGS